MEKRQERKEFQVPSELTEVQKASASVFEFLEPLSLSEGVIFDIRLSLEEGLVNAIKYGNKFQKHVPVHIEVIYDTDQIKIRIEDKGPGFDPKILDDCTAGENLLANHGRGVYLIRKLMDKVEYNAKGNCLTMVKSLHGGKHANKIV